MSDTLGHVTADRRLAELLDDLEAQAAALYAAERDVELADRRRAEYASVTLASRLMASVGTSVTVEVAGVGPVTGELGRVGQGWCLLDSDSGEWLVPLAAVIAVEGLSPRSVPEVAWPPIARLGLGSALRRLADDAATCTVFTRTGSSYEVVLSRVGADFVEAQVGGLRRTMVLSLAGVGAVRCRPESAG